MPRRPRQNAPRLVPPPGLPPGPDLFQQHWTPGAVLPTAPAPLEGAEPLRGIPKYGKRPATLEMDMRYAFVAQLLIQGWRSPLIAQKVAAETDWDVSTWTVDRYVAKAMEMVENTPRRAVRYLSRVAEQRWDDLYRMALAQGDVRGGAIALRELQKFRGVGSHNRRTMGEEPTTPTEPGQPMEHTPQRADTMVARARIIIDLVTVAEQRRSAAGGSVSPEPNAQPEG